jgi:outer membrane protein assembly factor BamD
MKRMSFKRTFRPPHLQKALIIGVILFWLTGCGLFKSELSKELERSPESLITEGMDNYQRKRYPRAIEAFQKLKDRFPYNQYAIVAELKLADSYFLNEDYELAAMAYKEFEKLHPANEIIPYVIFQLAMCNFKQMPSIDRDQSYAFRAIQDFERLLKSYPQSEYVSQAQTNLLSAKKNLVSHEFYIGEFYLKEGKYEAALGRFESIIQQFPDTLHPSKIKEYIQTCKQRLARLESQKTKSP